MMRDNIFLEDVQVPEIVQRKADSAFLAIQEGRSFIMNDMVKKEQNERKTGRYGFAGRIALAAACMAVVVAAGAVTGPLKNILGHSETGSEDALLTAVDEIDKLFTLQVKAADSEDGKTIPLAEGNPIPVTMKDNKTGSWMFGADDVEGSVVNYCINIPQIEIGRAHV